MKTFIIPTLIAVTLVGGAVFITKGNDLSSQPVDNVTVVEGKQIIEIRAKGGYSPRVTAARADMPSIIKVATSGTFDCSAALIIPSLGYRSNLSPSGIAEIEVPPQKVGTKLKGLCAMGMYNFSINFK